MASFFNMKGITGNEFQVGINGPIIKNDKTNGILNLPNALINKLFLGSAYSDTSYIDSTNYTGNSATASKLKTAIKLWGQSFDGSKDVSGNITGTGNITPSANNSVDLGSASLTYKTIYVNNIGTSLLPTDTQTYNLGSASNTWKTLYVDSILPAEDNQTNIGSSVKKYKEIFASTFNGNATSATKAVGDGDGRDIRETYWSLTSGTAINEYANINFYTSIGNYYCSTDAIAGTVSYAPTKKAFTLKIFYGDGITNVIQELCEYPSSKKYTRAYNVATKTWSAWSSINIDDYVLKSGDTMTGKLIVPKIETGTDVASYFQSRRFRGEGTAATYFHAVDFGYAGRNQVDFYEYGGIYNFWKNTSSTATTDSANKVASLQLGKLVERGNTLTYPGKSGTFALTSDITATAVGLDKVVNTGDSATPAENGTDKFTTGGAFTLLKNLPNDYVTLSTNQTITGLKTYAAPANVSGTEQSTVIYNTSNGGRIIFGKESANSGTMIALDQNAGTRRLNFRASSTAGVIVWEQPEANSSLFFDVNKIDFRKVTDMYLSNFKNAGYLYTDKNGKLQSGSLADYTKGYAKLDGGNTFTGQQIMNGAAADASLKVPGIIGNDGSGGDGDLYLQYQQTGKVYFGSAGKHYLDTDGSIEINNGNVGGNLTVAGNLTVQGKQTVVESTSLEITDNLITIAKGNTESLTSPAGIVVPKYDGENTGALVFDSNGIAYVGDTSLDDDGFISDTTKLQTIATRTGLVDGNLVKYDGTNLTLIDSGKKISDFQAKLTEKGSATLPIYLDANGDPQTITSYQGNSASASKVGNKLKIQLNSGTANEYDGSAEKTINITPSSIGAATSEHTHNYAGSSSAGGAATSANKLNTNAGSSTKPVYFSNGIPVAISSYEGNSATSTKWAATKTFKIQDNSGANIGSDVNVDGSTDVTLKLPSKIQATLDGGAYYLDSPATSRLVSANIVSDHSNAENGFARMRLDLATASMTTSKPVAAGFIQTYFWDNSNWDSQIFIPTDQTSHIQYRTAGTPNNGLSITDIWKDVAWYDDISTLKTSIIPESANAYNLGSTSNYFSNIYTTNIYTTNLTGSGNIKVSQTLYPDSNESKSLGTSSNKWLALYAKTLYGTLEKKLTIKVNGTEKAVFNNSADKEVNITLSDLGGASSNHTHTSLIGTITTTEDRTAENNHPQITVSMGELKYSSRILNGSAGLFPSSNNANSIITMNRHSGKYVSQLGFNAKGDIFYRSTDGTELTKDVAWKTLAFTTSNVASATKATNDKNDRDITSTYWSFNSGIEISSTEDNPADLNADTYRTIGNYYCPADVNAKTILNKPSDLVNAFTMKVYNATGSGYPAQEIHVYTENGAVYRRVYMGSSWTDWVLIRENLDKYARIADNEAITGVWDFSVNGSYNNLIKGKFERATEIINNAQSSEINLLGVPVGLSGNTNSAAQRSSSLSYTKDGTLKIGSGTLTSTNYSGTAKAVSNNLTIKLNNGSTEGTNLFTYNGSAAKSLNITASSIGAATTSAVTSAAKTVGATASDAKQYLVGVTGTGTSVQSYTNVKHWFKAGTLHSVSNETETSVSTPQVNLVTASGTAGSMTLTNKATMQYNSDDDCIEFIFA